jgi:hypothetical protein
MSGCLNKKISENWKNKGHFRQGSKDQKPRDQFEAN